MPQQAMTCAFCRGTGHNPHFGDSCPVCKGRGSNTITNKHMPCGACHGTGRKGGSTLTCYTCSGVGVVPDTQAAFRHARHEINKARRGMDLSY
jgi:DnaJ-class molecular chaperone